MIAWEGVCLHHSATRDGSTLSWPVIEYNHTVKKKWAAIGYHFGIERVRRTIDGKPRWSVQVLQGRPLYRIGAHTRSRRSGRRSAITSGSSAVGTNKSLIGICIVGNFDAKPVPKDVWAKAVDLVATLHLLFDWGRAGIFGPNSSVRGHCHFSGKTCPGRFFHFAPFRDEVRARLARLQATNFGRCAIRTEHGLWLPSMVKPL